MIENALYIIASYALLGAGIKYIDQAYDIGVFSKPKANLVAVLCGILMAYLIVTDPPSTAIFLAIVLSLAITRKIDNIAFYTGTVLVLLLPVFFDGVINIPWIPFGVLVLSGITDELGNDWADKRVKKSWVKKHDIAQNEPIYKFAERFFTYRFAMKVVILLLVVFDYFHWIYFFAFLFFDLMYTLIDVYSTSIKVYSINKAIMPVSK